MGNTLPVVAITVVGHDLGRHGAHIVGLDRGRVGWHDDDGPDAEELCGGGHALCMVAGREGDDAARALLLRQGSDLVICAAELERAGALQDLRLEEKPGTELVVERRRFQKRRPPRQSVDPAGGRAYVVYRGHRGKGGLGVYGHWGLRQQAGEAFMLRRPFPFYQRIIVMEAIA